MKVNISLQFISSDKNITTIKNFKPFKLTKQKREIDNSKIE